MIKSNLGSDGSGNWRAVAASAYRELRPAVDVTLVGVKYRLRREARPRETGDRDYAVLQALARGKRCILVDDEILTGGSMIEAADLLMANGAREVYAAAVHAVLAGNALERLSHSAIRELVTTDSLHQPAAKDSAFLRVLSIAPLLAEVIQRIHSGVSIDTIFRKRSPVFG